MLFEVSLYKICCTRANKSKLFCRSFALSLHKIKIIDLQTTLHYPDMPTYAPFAHPLYVMLKPAGSLCNLNCDYCYYTEKGDMYRSCGAGNRMTISDELLEKFTRQYIEAQTQPQVLFTWHGGEPLMRPICSTKKRCACSDRTREETK